MTLRNLEKIRQNYGYTFKKVAEEAGLTKEHYWMIEKQKRGLSYENAVLIAKVFNKNPDDIFLDTELTNEEQEVS